MCTDSLCWGTGRQISLVDKTQEDARQKLRNIVAVAYGSLDADLKARFVVNRSNAGEFGVRFHEFADSRTNQLFAGTHARGGANSFLWISEWGYVQCEDLRRSEEILTGALPSAKDGPIVVETTWRGGRGGHLWDIVKKALEMPEDQKLPDDWRVIFFPWQDEPAYCDAQPQPLTEEALRYFSDKPGFSLGQMSWYQRARDQYGMFIKREFPTVIEECFQTPIEERFMPRSSTGCALAAPSGPAVVDISSLVHTAWDLGSPLNTVTWYFQLVGAEIRVIDCDHDLDLTPVQRVARMLSKGYLYGSHYLPHDALATQNFGKDVRERVDWNWLAELQGGAANTRYLDRHQSAPPDPARGLLSAFQPASAGSRHCAIITPCVPHRRALQSTNPCTTGRVTRHRP